MPHVEVPQAEFRVVMLGDTFTGKTSLVLRFAEGYYRESARSATVGAFFITKRLTVNGLTCKIQIWDTAGQEKFKKLAPMYYQDAAAAIICYDISSPKSFETLKYWIDELQRNVPAGQIVMAMCATKSDLTSNPDTTMAEDLAQQTGSMFFTTSAKNNTNVTELFEQVAQRVLQFQRRNSDLRIPVTLATTPVDTASKAQNGSPAYSGSAATPGPLSPSTTQNENSRDVASTNREDREPGEDDDNVIDPAAETEKRHQESAKRCDTNMLMCGDILGAHEAASSSNCTIM